jgi:hypothetical protein
MASENKQVEQQEFSLCGNAKWCNVFERHFGSFFKEFNVYLLIASFLTSSCSTDLTGGDWRCRKDKG